MSEPLKGGFASFSSGSPFKPATGAGTGLFGNSGTSTSTPGATASTPGTAGAFTGFGGKHTVSTTLKVVEGLIQRVSKAKPATPGSTAFGGAATNTNTAPTTGGGLFAGFGSTASSNAPASGSTPSTAPASGNLFGAKPPENTSASATKPTSGCSSIYSHLHFPLIYWNI